MPQVCGRRASLKRRGYATQCHVRNISTGASRGWRCTICGASRSINQPLPQGAASDHAFARRPVATFVISAMRYPGLTLRILGAGNPAMGPGEADLISRIEAAGSISAAAREMGMSYRRAWQLVEAINASFTKPVVVTAIGGKRGGGASVTAFGRELVAHFRAMENKASAAIADDVAHFTRQLRKPAARRKAG